MTTRAGRRPAPCRPPKPRSPYTSRVSLTSRLPAREAEQLVDVVEGHHAIAHPHARPGGHQLVEELLVDPGKEPGLGTGEDNDRVAQLLQLVGGERRRSPRLGHVGELGAVDAARDLLEVLA